MFDLSDTEKKTLYFWGITALIVIILVLLFVKTKVIKDQEVVKSVTAKNTNHINDRARYYTVAGALEKYYSFSNAKDYDSMLKIINEDYIKKNDLNSDNIFEKEIKTDSKKSYEPGIMCLKKYKKGIYIYSVGGTEVGMNTGEEIEKRYYEVVLDGNTFLFSVKPISEKQYRRDCNE